MNMVDETISIRAKEITIPNSNESIKELLHLIKLLIHNPIWATTKLENIPFDKKLNLDCARKELIGIYRYLEELVEDD